jgi:hypothetical protein
MWINDGYASIAVLNLPATRMEVIRKRIVRSKHSVTYLVLVLLVPMSTRKTFENELNDYETTLLPLQRRTTLQRRKRFTFFGRRNKDGPSWKFETVLIRQSCKAIRT